MTVLQNVPDSTLAVPAHVPVSKVFDFDGFRPMQGETTYHEAYARARGEGAPDIFWSPYNGGHWIVAKRDYQAEAFADFSRFTSAQGASVDKIVRPDEPRLAPIEADPPHQQVMRRLFSPAFIAPALKQREAEARQIAIELIEGFKAKGECEFVTGFAQHLPIRIFMNMVDLPESDRLRLLPLASAQVEVDASKEEAMAQIFAYAGQKIAERRERPGTDLISKIVTAEIEGRPITDFEAMGVVSLLLIGGLDTVASMMGHVMLFLATHPDKRRELISDLEGLTGGAVEEFLRRFALTNPARTVVGDIEFHGVAMKAGDKVMLATPFGAIDPTAYDNPLEVDFARKSNTKTTFGAGPHVCPGSMLARIELRILLEEWMTRIPEFRLDDARPPRVRTGVNGSVQNLWLTSQP